MKQSNKKTLICVLLCALFCAVTAFAFAGCKKTEAAKKYAVIFMDGETQISEQTVEANKEAVKPADPTKESTVGEVYTFAGWSLTDGGETVTDFTIKADTTFYAVYTSSIRQYKVTFMNGTEKLSENDVDYNGVAAAPATNPSKPSDAGNDYTFAGWSLSENGETVTDFTIKADTTFYAVYTSSIRQYKVTFMNGTEKLSENDVDYNGVAAAPATNPSKPSDAGNDYTFAGWSLSENGETVTDFTIKADTTFYAVYTSSTRQYKVTFMNGSEKLSESDVDYNGVAAAPTQTPAKESTVDTVYTFAGWSLTDGGEKVDELKITGDTTFYAVYTPATRQYKVTFMNGSEKLSESDVDYNGVAVAPTQTPAKESTVDTVYAFAGWALTDGGEKVDELKITGDTTFYAVYTPSVRKYNVQFIGDDLDVTVSVNARENVPALKDEEGALGRKIVGYYSDEEFGTEFDTEAEILKDTVVYVKLSDYVYFNGAMLNKFTDANATKTLNGDGTLTVTGVNGSFIHKKDLNLAMNDTNGLEIKIKTDLHGGFIGLHLFGEYTQDGVAKTSTDYGTPYYRGRNADGFEGWSCTAADSDGYVVMTFDLAYISKNATKSDFAFRVINGLRINISSGTESKITIDYIKSIKIDSSYNVNYYVNGAVKKTATVKEGEKAVALKDEEGALGRQIVGYYTDAAFTQVFDIANAAVTKDTNLYVKLSDYVYFNGAMLNKFTDANATKTLNGDGTLTVTGVNGSFIHKKDLNLAMNDTNGLEIKIKTDLHGGFIGLHLFGEYTQDGVAKTSTDYGTPYYRGRNADGFEGWSCTAADSDGYVVMTFDLAYISKNATKSDFAFRVINGLRINISSGTESKITIDYIKSIKIDSL